jgi:hypothetical protein
MDSRFPHESDRPALPAPQYGLRTLFWGVTALCVLFTTMTLLGAMWSSLLAIMLLLVGGHVAGNAIGTSLRDHSPGSGQPREPVARAAPVAREPSPPTRLQQRQQAGWLMLLVAATCAMIGGVAGSCLVALHYGEAISAVSFAFGTLAAAVLGGMVGFIGCSFVGIAMRTWREAVREHDARR